MGWERSSARHVKSSFQMIREFPDTLSFMETLQ